MPRIRLTTTLLVILSATTLSAQIPETFTNLQVIPEAIERRALIDTMRDFSGALGVQCIHCHVGENADTLEGFDFASDDKETKRVARAMMLMTREINDKLLPKTGREKLLTVKCQTCHHGVQKPQSLGDILAAELAAGGVEAVGAKYRELHEEYHGKGAYDFGEFTLTTLAEDVARGKDGDAETAMALLDLNTEFHPESAYSFMLKGRIFSMTGSPDKAIKNFERALEIEPENEWARGLLERLKKAKSEEGE